MSTENRIVLRTPPFRMSYAKLIEPKPFLDPATKQPKGDPTYNVDMLFSPDDLENFEQHVESGWEKCEIKRKLVELAKREWGSDFDIQGACKHGGMKWPVQSGDAVIEKKGESKNEHLKGKVIIPAKATQAVPPELVVPEKGGFRSLSRSDPQDMNTAKELFASGHWARAWINLKPNLVDGRKYLTFYLDVVMFVKRDDKFGGMSDAERFKGIEGGSADHDPTEGMSSDIDDEIPF